MEIRDPFLGDFFPLREILLALFSRGKFDLTDLKRNYLEFSEVPFE